MALLTCSEANVCGDCNRRKCVIPSVHPTNEIQVCETCYFVNVENFTRSQLTQTAPANLSCADSTSRHHQLLQENPLHQSSHSSKSTHSVNSSRGRSKTSHDASPTITSRLYGYFRENIYVNRSPTDSTLSPRAQTISHKDSQSYSRTEQFAMTMTQSSQSLKTSEDDKKFLQRTNSNPCFRNFAPATSALATSSSAKRPQSQRLLSATPPAYTQRVTFSNTTAPTQLSNRSTPTMATRSNTQLIFNCSTPSASPHIHPSLIATPAMSAHATAMPLTTRSDSSRGCDDTARYRSTLDTSASTSTSASDTYTDCSQPMNLLCHPAIKSERTLNSPRSPRSPRAAHIPLSHLPPQPVTKPPDNPRLTMQNDQRVTYSLQQVYSPRGHSSYGVHEVTERSF